MRLPFALLATLCASSALAQTPTYRVSDRFAVGGEGGWDYLTVDSDAHRLYVSRSTRVVVIDTTTGKTVGEIADTPGVHGIALIPRLGRGYTSNGRDNSVTVFDLKSLKTLGKIPVGQSPDAIVYEPSANRVITCNGRSGDLSFIDPDAGKVVGTVKLDGRPEEPASDGKTLFVNIEDKSEIERVDLKTMRSLGAWSIAPVEEPSGIAFDKKRHLLFSVGSNKMMAVVDSRTGKVVATPPIGDGSDGAGYDARRDLVFSSNGEGTLTVLKRGKDGSYTVVQTLATQRSARTMTLDPKTGTIYLSAAEAAPGEGRRAMVPGSFRIIVVAPDRS
ncbi:hypothetical protein BH11ARM2_BH11ARM2_10430 [soil metagenome]